jgi:hypothetical protein
VNFFNINLSVLVLSCAIFSTTTFAQTANPTQLTGKDKQLVVSEALSLNEYHEVSSPILSGSKTIQLETPVSYKKGDLIMVVEMKSIDANNTYEVAVVEAIAGKKLILSSGLTHSYSAENTQVLNVPEFTKVEITPSGSINSMPWNGHTGGVLAFKTKGNIINNGLISASESGIANNGGSKKGGQVYLDAEMIVGTGTIQANGQRGVYKFADAGIDGGNGGFIHLSAKSIDVPFVTALGGDGSSVGANTTAKPGNGGDGGMILVESENLTSSLEVNGGSYGTNRNKANGAVNGLDGRMTVVNKHIADGTAPTIISPSDNELVSDLQNTVVGLARPNSVVYLYDKDRVLLGSTNSDAKGNFEITTSFGTGIHTVYATYNAKEAVGMVTFEVITDLGMIPPQIETVYQVSLH